MLFASVETAARVERAECRLLTDAAAAMARRRSGVDAITSPVAGGVATFAGAESPMNKVAGLGFAGPIDERELEEIEQAWAQRATPVQVELSCLADPSIGVMLTRRGYELRGFENVLGRCLRAFDDDLRNRNEAIAISECGDSELSRWVDITVAAFAQPDTQGVPSHESFPREALERAIRDAAETSGMVRYLARIDAVPVGAASMKIFEGVAQLCGSATLPSHRRRGVQSAQLRERLAAAAHAGCDIATVTTLPGSKSQENVQKRGFEVLYTRAILVREM